MKYRILITALALALITGISVRAEDQPAAKPGHEGHHRPMGFLPPPMVEKLTVDQKTKYDAIVADFQKDTPDLREKMKAAREAKDEAKIKELREQMAPFFKAAMGKVMDILTDEQKAELKKMREQRGGQHGGAHGKPAVAPQQ